MVWLSKHEKKFQGAVFVDVDVKNFTETGCCLYARSQITNYDNVKTYNTLIFNIQLHSGFRLLFSSLSTIRAGHLWIASCWGTTALAYSTVDPLGLLSSKTGPFTAHCTLFNKFQPENYISNPDETIIYLDDFWNNLRYQHVPHTPVA